MIPGHYEDAFHVTTLLRGKEVPGNAIRKQVPTATGAAIAGSHIGRNENMKLYCGMCLSLILPQ